MKREIRSYITDKQLISNRRKGLVQAATRLFIKNGYHRTTVQQLAEAIDISVGGLYRYIGSKDDIIRLTLEFAVDNRIELFDKITKETRDLSPTETLKRAIEMYLDNADELQDMYNFHNHIVIYLSKERRKILFDGEKNIVAFFEDLLMKGIQKGEFKINNAWLLAYNITIIVNSWANRRWLLRKYINLEEYKREQVGHILKSTQ